MEDYRWQSVRMWVDRWLPSLPLGHPQHGLVPVTRDTRVASLLMSFPRMWNIGFLQPFLSAEEMNAILETPVGDAR